MLISSSRESVCRHDSTGVEPGMSCHCTAGRSRILKCRMKSVNFDYSGIITVVLESCHTGDVEDWKQRNVRFPKILVN